MVGVDSGHDRNGPCNLVTRGIFLLGSLQTDRVILMPSPTAKCEMRHQRTSLKRLQVGHETAGLRGGDRHGGVTGDG